MNFSHYFLTSSFCSRLGKRIFFFSIFSFFKWEFRILNALFRRFYMVPGYFSINHTQTIKINGTCRYFITHRDPCCVFNLISIIIFAFRIKRRNFPNGPANAIQGNKKTVRITLCYSETSYMSFFPLAGKNALS